MAYTTNGVDGWRRNRLLLVLPIVLSASLVSCSSSSDDPEPETPSADDTDSEASPPENDNPVSTTGNLDVVGANFYVNDAGSARVTGPVLGGTGNDDSFAARDIPFTVLNEHSDLKIVNVRTAAVYNGLGGKLPGIIGIVENVSTQLHCGVVMDNTEIVFSETSGIIESLGDVGSPDIDGAAGDDGSIIQNSCAAPGSKYYFHAYLPVDSTSDFESVQIERIATFADSPVPVIAAATFELVPPTVLATSYDINEGGNVDINIVSQSTETIESTIFGTTIYGLNTEGETLFAAVEDGVGELSPGAEGIVTMNSSATDYPGQSSQLRVNVSFDTK